MRFRPSRRFLVLAVLTAGLVAVLLLLLPEVVRRVMIDKLQERMAISIGADDVDINLFTGRASVKGFLVGRSGSPSPILHLPRIEADLSYLALLRGALVLKSLTFTRPELFLEHGHAGHWNFSDLLVSSSDTGEPRPALTIEHLKIDRGRLRFVDRAQPGPFQLSLDAIELNAGGLSTLPELALTPTRFALKLNLGSGSISINGSATPLASSPGVELTARWQKLDLGMFTAYLPKSPVLDLSAGQTHGEARYSLVYHQSRVTVDEITAGLEMGPARLLPIDSDTPVLDLEKVTAQDLKVDLLAKSVHVGELVLTRPNLLIERNEAGNFNVARLFPPESAESDASPNASFSVAVGKARAEKGTIELVDRSLVPTMRNIYRDVEISLDGVDLDPGAEPGRVRGTAQLEGASVQIAGTLKPRPISTRLRLDAKEIPLNSFQGYLAALTGAADYERQGRMDLAAEVAFSSMEDGRAELEVSGQARGKDLALRLAGSNEPFFTAVSFAIEQTRFKVLPAIEAEFGRIEINEPVLRVERDSQGRWNLGRLEIENSEKPQVPSAAAPQVRLKRLDLVQGKIEFADHAVAPDFSVVLSDLSAELQQATGGNTTDVRINAKLDASTPLELSGSLSLPVTPTGVDLKGGLRDYDLSKLTPYAEKYIGYRIRRGRVSTQGEYAFGAGGKFSTDSSITFRQLELGDKIDNDFDEKIGIPLTGALALLEGANGEVRLDIPVNGNLSNPEFSVAPVVWKAVQGAVIKALTAPFRLIGNVLTLGGKIGEVRIAPVPFVAGTLELDPSTRETLGKIADFLKAKPRVKLELRGRAAAGETEALKKQMLRVQIEALKAPSRDNALTTLYRRAGGREGLGQSVSAEAKERYLLERIQVTNKELQKLGEERGRAVEQALMALGIAAERLFVVGAEEKTVTDTPPGRTEFKVLY